LIFLLISIGGVAVMFFGLTVGEIVDYIILGGALVGAVYKIFEFFAKPTSKIK
jgi:uncharacterized membrane protein